MSRGQAAFLRRPVSLGRTAVSLCLDPFLHATLPMPVSTRRGDPHASSTYHACDAVADPPRHVSGHTITPEDMHATQWIQRRSEPNHRHETRWARPQLALGMPATSAIDLGAVTDLSGGQGVGTSCRAISPSGQGSMASASGAATGQGRREVGADQHALPPEDAEGHRQRVPKALAELQVGVGKVGGALSLREGHR